MPPIGKLTKRIDLQSPSDTTDPYGQPTRGWATYATVWAQIIPTGGSEPSVGDEQQQERVHKVIIRYTTGVFSTHRALYGSRVLNFQSVIDPDERHEWLEIEATERTG